MRVLGKGRKERCTPFGKKTVVVLKEWLREPARYGSEFLFPNEGWLPKRRRSTIHPAPLLSKLGFRVVVPPYGRLKADAAGSSGVNDDEIGGLRK